MYQVTEVFIERSILNLIWHAHLSNSSVLPACISFTGISFHVERRIGECKNNVNEFKKQRKQGMRKNEK